ncbi:MAG: hypothetical protein AB1791_14115 [Chloroflexota bacterium]
MSTSLRRRIVRVVLVGAFIALLLGAPSTTRPTYAGECPAAQAGNCPG